MNDIEDVSSRIMSAMERISRGVDQLAEGTQGKIETLQAALDGEKQVNSELSERVQALEERQEQAIAALESRAKQATDRVASLDKEIQQLRAANTQLISACDALRDANAEGLASADLIDQSLKAELDALRSLRDAEMTEAKEIISALTPILRASAQSPQPQETS